MSSSTNSIGKSGESSASTHLIKMGFKIIERNWRWRRKEIDIIAEYQEYIVFVEVKTRENNSFGNPEDFVSRKQQRHIIAAADAYITEKDIDKEARFDIIAITNNFGKEEILHIPDAFYPLL